MSEPTIIAIPELELKEWLKQIQHGLNPSVKFSKDNKDSMLEEAYDIRGGALYYINHRLRSFLPTQL